MKHIYFSHANEADICLIAEGTYPLTRGGVAHWISEFVRVFPQYTFAVIFLGTKLQDYQGIINPVPPNVVHLEAHFIFSAEEAPKFSGHDMPESLKQTTKKMHDQFKTFLNDGSDTAPEVFELMGSKREIDEGMFLRSQGSWELIVNSYKEEHADQSFFDYFWGVRNLHRPFWALAKIVGDIPKVKAIHSTSTGYAGFLGALLQKHYKIPYILTEHGLYTKERWIDLMGTYFFQDMTNAAKLAHTEQGLINLWINFFAILGKIAYRAANPVISLFEEYRAKQIKGGALPETTRIISYGIDFNDFKYLGKPLNKKNPVIAFIGRVVPIKDVKTFIRACALILLQIPNAQVVILGTIEEDKDYYLNCKNLVKMLGLDMQVQFLGNQNLAEFYPDIDLLMLTSISEGSPFVILESFAVGIPVVTTDVGGCRELIEGKNEEDRLLGSAGRLVNIADAEGLCNAALELLTDEAAWKRAQKIGKERVRKYYSMEQLIEKYSLIYGEALSHGRNRI